MRATPAQLTAASSRACKATASATIAVHESGLVTSTATALHDVVAEIAATEITERGETRADDRVSEAAMEDRKVARYF